MPRKWVLPAWKGPDSPQTPVPAGDWPVRQQSAHGEPKPSTSIERTCRGCGASFIGLAPGRTGERGIWRDWKWYCSAECDPFNGSESEPALSGEEWREAANAEKARQARQRRNQRGHRPPPPIAGVRKAT